MTVIAWKAGIMASDSCWSYDNIRTTSMTKVDRLASGALLGSAGDFDIRSLLAMLDRVRTPKQLPRQVDLRGLRIDFEGILALPGGGVFQISIGPGGDGTDLEHYDAQIWPVSTGFAAAGSGRHLALAAMMAGRTARQAVAIACQLHTECKLPVHSLALNPVKKPRRSGSKVGT